MDQQLADMERAFQADPSNLSLLTRIVQVYERSGQVYQGAVLDEALETLKSPDKTVRQTAVPVLIALGKAAIPGLIAILRTEKWPVCRKASQILGRMGRIAFSSLLGALDRKSPRIQTDLLRAIAAMAKDIQSELPDVARAVAAHWSGNSSTVSKLFEKQGPHAVAFFKVWLETGEANPNEVFGALAKGGDEGVEVCFEYLSREMTPGLLNGLCVELAKQGEVIFDRLLGLLGSEKPDERRGAIFCLGYMNSSEAVTQALENAFDDPDETVRAAVVAAFSKKSVISKAILEKGLIDESTLVRAAVGHCLTSCDPRSPEFRKLYQICLEDPSPAVRRTAFEALGNWPYIEFFVPYLREALSGTDSSIAVVALGCSVVWGAEVKELLPLIEQLCQSPTKWVRWQARYALRQLSED